MTAYYNEYDAKTAAWLRELIKAGLIADGEVDERSIIDVKADDLRGFSQCHFFAGIGGWSYALRLAGWSDDRPVWTGSPPCQPFSNAGKQKAQADARHLWPVFFNLIRKCQPAIIFGEQVEAAIRTGWLDDLQDDLEAENYATGKIVLPACSVGAPHIRQRIWFVAERLADTDNQRSQGRCGVPERADELAIGSGSVGGGVADTGLQRQAIRQQQAAGREPCSEESGLGNTEHDGQHGTQVPGRSIETGDQCQGRQIVSSEPERTGGPVVSRTLRNWENPDWLYCRDGKWRPVEPGTQPLADGVSERVGLLRGYGNAIVPQVAAEVIKAYMGAEA